MKINMTSKKTALFSVPLLALVLLTSACRDFETFDSKIYLTSTVPVTTYVKASGQSGQNMTGEVTLSIPKPESEDVIFTLATDASLISAYSASYGAENVKALPEEHYRIKTKGGTIVAGTLSSDPIQIEFLDIGTLDYNSTYVLPVYVIYASIPILESGRTTYFVFKGAALINKVANIKENNVYVDWVNPDVVQGMHQLTAEALIRPHGFTNKLNTLFGIEGQFLFRYGDSGVEPNQLQIATGRGNHTSEALQLQTDEWVHVAITYDYDASSIIVYYNGKMMADFTGEVSYGPVNWGIPHSDESSGNPRCFWIGYSYSSDRWFDTDISEVRIWNRVLTRDEINSPNHFYSVDEDSDGLVVYWKFDDGADIILDHSGNGNNATASAPLTWLDVELPAKD